MSKEDADKDESKENEEEDFDLDDDDSGDTKWWEERGFPGTWDEEELQRIAWDDDDNPWKKETMKIRDEKRFLENEVMRLQNKVMLLNGELNRIK